MFMSRHFARMAAAMLIVGAGARLVVVGAVDSLRRVQAVPEPRVAIPDGGMPWDGPAIDDTAAIACSSHCTGNVNHSHGASVERPEQLEYG